MSTLPETAPIFSCPQCHTPVRASDAVCHACGINLALAAVLAERYTRANMPADEAAGARRHGRVAPLRRVPGRPGLYHRRASSRPAWPASANRRRWASTRLSARPCVALGALTAQQLELASIEQVKRSRPPWKRPTSSLEQRVAERTQALQTAVQRLTELDELKANFIANISHELRTPLVPMKGFADLLLNGSLGSLGDGQYEAVETISRSSQRLETLINQLIQFASSVKGKLTINLTIVYLPDLVEPLWDYFQPRADMAGIVLSRQLPDGLPLAMADAERIYWVLYQLLDNAIKFTPSGGTVTVGAEPRGNRLRISVADTGMGIGPEQLGTIFQPFSQGADGNSGQLVDGTGLGLALVKRIVNAHNAQVEVESVPGQGSTFAFELALARPAAART